MSYKQALVGMKAEEASRLNEFSYRDWHVGPTTFSKYACRGVRLSILI